MLDSQGHILALVCPCSCMAAATSVSLVCITKNHLSYIRLLCLICRLVWHFDLNKYRPSERPRVIVSLAAVAAFALVGWPLIIAKFGIAGWLKMWLMPWLGYHFWVSAWGRWTASKGQLNSSVVDAHKQSYMGSETHQGSAMAHIFLCSAV